MFALLEWNSSATQGPPAFVDVNFSETLNSIRRFNAYASDVSSLA